MIDDTNELEELEIKLLQKNFKQLLFTTRILPARLFNRFHKAAYTFISNEGGEEREKLNK